MKPHLFAAITIALVTSAAGSAHATYSVQTPTGCVVFTDLPPSVGSPLGAVQIFVQDTNLEYSPTTIEGDVTFTAAMAPCTAGGSGTIQVAAGTPSRMFEVSEDATLTLQAVTVAGGNVTDNGGTILVHQDAVLLMQQGSTVRDGVAGMRGGCIYMDHALIIMDLGTTVTNCHATIDGGGVAIQGTGDDGGDNVLHNLTANTASGSGGGTWIDGAPVCLYEAAGNVATLDGGAAYVTSASGVAWLGTYATQSTNTANRDGGDVFITGSLATLDADSSIQSNYASGNGGGIRVTGAASAFLDPGNTIKWNNAHGDGGGVHGDGGSKIFANKFTNAGQIGSGEGYQGPCGTPSGLVKIDGNGAGHDANGNRTSALRNGGGIYLASSTFTKDPDHQQYAQLKIQNNDATNDGGGVAAYAGANVTVTHVDVVGNTAVHGNGGGFLANTTSLISLTVANFVNNSALLGGGGGAALVATTTPSTSVPLLDQNLFDSNHGFAGGGLGLNSNAKATVTRANVTSNGAVWGGGIYSGNGSALTMLSGMVTQNTANLGGGAAADGAAITFGGPPPPPLSTCDPTKACCAGLPCVAITQNTATGTNNRGGAIVLLSDNALAQVNRSVIGGNTADAGGALWMDRASQTLNVVNTAVLSNLNPAGTLPAIGAQAGTLGLLNATIAHHDIGLNLWPATVATMNQSLVVQNGLDINGLTTGASMSGSCNAVTSAATAAAIAGTTNVATTTATASVDGTTGAPINTAEIVNRCASALLPIDIVGNPRPVGGSADRGAYEVP